MHDNVGDKRAVGRFVSKALETVSVGSIVAFEEQFGYLWGNGKDPKELTEDEAEFREMWMEVRAKIFGRADESKKTVREFIEQFSIRKKRFFLRGSNGN